MPDTRDITVTRARGPEFTKVSDETERKIPLRTWLTCSFVSACDVLAGVGILVLASRQVWNWRNPPRVYGSGWWPGVWRTLLVWWPSVGIAMLSSVIAWSVPLLKRLWLETRAKQFPQYGNWPAEWGIFDGKPRDTGVEYEADAAEPAEPRPYQVDGKIQLGDNTMIYLRFQLDNYDSALKWHKFCRAVHKRRRNFSYTEAVKRHHLSDDDWTRIYGAFTAQRWVVPAGRRGTPELKAVGRHWVRLFAENPPPPFE